MMILKCPQLSSFSCIEHSFLKMNPEDYPSPLAVLDQIHGTKVHHVTKAGIYKYKGDGLVTNVKGVALGIMTADCGPVLFYDPEANVIGACHAGWRGAKAGILQATLKEMEILGAQRSRIHVSLGPTIQQQNYEVGPEFPDLIGEHYETFFVSSQKEGHHYFNLPLYICQQLKTEGIIRVHDTRCDTFTSYFASRRRGLAEGYKEISIYNLSTIAIL